MDANKPLSNAEYQLLMITDRTKYDLYICDKHKLHSIRKDAETSGCPYCGVTGVEYKG